MKFLKRSLALVLTLALLLGLAVPGVGADTTGAETPEDSTENYVKLSLQAIQYDSSKNATVVTSVKAGDEFYIRVNFENYPEVTEHVIELVLAYDSALMTVKQANSGGYLVKPKNSDGKSGYPDGISFTENLHSATDSSSSIKYVTSAYSASQKKLCNEDDEVLTTGNFGEVKFVANGTIDMTEQTVIELTNEGPTNSSGAQLSTKLAGDVTCGISVSNARLTIIKKNSLVIYGAENEIDPIPNDNEALGENSVYTVTGYGADYYNAEGVKDDSAAANIVWSVSGNDNVEIDTDGGLKIKSAKVADGNTFTLTASYTPTEGTTITASKTITIKKSASVLTAYQYTVEDDTSSVTVSQTNKTYSFGVTSGAQEKKLRIISGDLYDQYGAMIAEDEITFSLADTLTAQNVAIDVNEITIPAGTNATGDMTILYKNEEIARITLNITKETPVATDILFYYYTDGMGSENPAQIVGGSVTLPIPDEQSYNAWVYGVVIDQYENPMTDIDKIVPTYEESQKPNGVTSVQTNNSALRFTVEKNIVDSGNFALTASCSSGSTTVNRSMNVKFYDITCNDNYTVQTTATYGKTWAELLPYADNSFEPKLNNTELTGGEYQRAVGDNFVKADDVPNAGTYNWKIYYKNTQYTNYFQNFIIASGTITISRQLITDDVAVTLDETQFTYDGTEKQPGVKVTYNGKELQLYSTESGTGDYIVTYENNVNAGGNTAKVTVSSPATGGNYQFSKTVNFTINPADASNATVTLAGVESSVYDDTDKKPSNITVTFEGKNLTEKSGGTGDYTVSYLRGETETEDFINAGEITVKITFCGNYTGTASKTYTIAKADRTGLSIDVKQLLTDNTATEFKYGTAYALSLNGGTDDDVVRYEISSGNAKIETVEDTVRLIPTGTGEVTIKATVDATANQNTATVTTTIKIQTGSIAIPTSQTFTYDGEEKNYTYTVSEHYTATGTATETDVGDYTVTFTLKEPNNMAWITPAPSDCTLNDDGTATVTWRITKTAAKTGLTSSKELLYSSTDTQTFAAADIARMLDENTGTKAQITSVTVADTDGILAAMGEGTDKYAIDTDGANVTYKLADGLAKDKAGKTATLTITGTSNNYQGFTLTLTVKVLNKETVGVTYAGGKATYTGSAIANDVFQTATLTNGGTNAANPNWTYTIYKGESAAAANRVENMVNAGTYYVVANYEDDQYAGSASATFTVEPAEISVQSADVEKDYDGNTEGDVISNVVFCVPAGTAQPDSTDYSAVNAQFEDADAGTGKQVSIDVKLAETVNAKNYKLAGASTNGWLTVTLNTGVINPKPIAPTVADIRAQEYTGNAITPEPTVTCTGVTSETDITALVKDRDYTLTYTNNTNAGTATITVSQVEGGNYTFEPVTKNFTINPKTVNVPTAKTDLVFNGTEQTGVESGAGYTLTGNTGTNAGSYTAVATLTDTTNYKWSDDSTAPKNIPWSIAKSNQQFLPSTAGADVKKTYRYDAGSSDTVDISNLILDTAGTATCKIGRIWGNSAILQSSSISGNVVSYELKAFETYPGNTDNWCQIPVTVTMQNYANTITYTIQITLTDKNTPTVTVTDQSAVYDGTVKKLADLTTLARATYDSQTVAGTWAYEGGAYQKNGETETDASIQNAGIYYVKVKFTPTDGDTYNVAYGEAKITITKATPTLNAETDDDGRVIYDDEAETLNDVLSATDFTPGGGTLVWKENGKTIHGDTALADIEDVEDITWSYTPEDETNYNTVTGGIVEEESSNGWIIGALGGLFGGSHSPLDDFSDLSRSAWYADAVEYCLENDLMSGVGDGKFAPDGSMTRAMVWTVLGRLSGETFSGTGANWYADAQSWAMANGISDGTNPNGLVTREELVTMLWRFDGCPAADVALLNNYNDGASVSDWAKTAMAWAVSVQLVEGSNWNLTPSATALRCQVAAIFMRYHRYC